MSIDWSQVEAAIRSGRINIPRFDYEIDEAYLEEKKINGFAVFQEAGRFYIRSLADWSTDWHDDRAISYAEGTTIEEAIEAWLRDPGV